MVTAIIDIIVRYCFAKEYVRKTILIPKPPNCDETGDDDVRRHEIIHYHYYYHSTY